MCSQAHASNSVSDIEFPLGTIPSRAAAVVLKTTFNGNCKRMSPFHNVYGFATPFVSTQLTAAAGYLFAPEALHLENGHDLFVKLPVVQTPIMDKIGVDLMAPYGDWDGGNIIVGKVLSNCAADRRLTVWRGSQRPPCMSNHLKAGSN